MLTLKATGFPSLPELGMLPPRERLRRHHPAGGQLDLGLVVGDQLAAAQRLREFGLQSRGQVFGFDCLALCQVSAVGYGARQRNAGD